MITVPFALASLEGGTSATALFELVNATVGIGDFGIDINIAVAEVFEPTTTP